MDASQIEIFTVRGMIGEEIMFVYFPALCKAIPAFFCILAAFFAARRVGSAR